MNASEHAEVLVTAGFLRAAGRLDWLGTGLTMVAAAAILHAGAIAAMILGFVAKSYFVRIGFDARLLEDVAARKLETADLDTALATLSDRERGNERSWPDRCRGARRLVAIASALTALQGVAILLTALL